MNIDMDLLKQKRIIIAFIGCCLVLFSICYGLFSKSAIHYREVKEECTAVSDGNYIGIKVIRPIPFVSVGLYKLTWSYKANGYDEHATSYCNYHFVYNTKVYYNPRNPNIYYVSIDNVKRIVICLISMVIGVVCISSLIFKRDY